MANSLLIFVAIVLYLTSSALIATQIRTGSATDTSENRLKIGFGVAFIALLAHLIAASQLCFINGSLNFGLSSMALLISGIVTGIFLLGGLAMPIRRLGILVFPLTVLSLLFSMLWKTDSATLPNTGLAFNAHILISLTAYALLTIAAIQALLYVFQERQIKKRTNPAMLMALPPLQTMEALLFRLVAYGFGFLTLALVSGAIFSQQIFGHAFAFKHHTILAVLGWLVFAVLLYKRAKQGLRGSQAVVWTIGGFLLIQLGYFGTKIVSESLTVQ